jgi:hypothetical protein
VRWRTEIQSSGWYLAQQVKKEELDCLLGQSMFDVAPPWLSRSIAAITLSSYARSLTAPTLASAHSCHGDALGDS